MYIVLSLSLVVFGMGTASVEETRFAPPVPLRANGEVISVTTGHAAPYIYDFDGDGTQDLLVGEFGNKPFKGETTGKASAGHPWTAGKLRVYRNHGTDTEPVYKEFSYVQAGGQDAQVPITCCVSFVPQFVDINDDGRDDIVTGSYPGDIYFYENNSEGGFHAPVLQRDIKGDPVHPKMKYRGEYHDVHSITAEMHDMDGDDDLDLVIGSRLNGCFLIENVGNRSEPKWAVLSERMKTADGKEIGGWDYGSNVHFTDWDEDGKSDIVVGSEDGGIFWHRNIGEENAPQFGEMKTLVVEAPLDERFLKLQMPMGPSSRVKVHVVDYDGDGLKDMLVGDFGSKWTRIRTLSAEQKATCRSLEAELDALHEESRNGAKSLANNDEREAYFEEFSKKTDPLYEKLEEFETHRSTTTGYVWYFKQLPKSKLDLVQKTQQKKTDLSKESQIKLLSHGLTITPSTDFPVALVIRIPEGWTACGNADAVHAAESLSLPTSIEWDLPTGCTVAKTTWQDADENALYEGTFVIEAILDTSGMTESADLTIAADIRFQRCNKKSGICILERDRLELPVTVTP